MDPFSHLIINVQNAKKLQNVVEALRCIPIPDNESKERLEKAIQKIEAPQEHNLPEAIQRIQEFTFTEPELSYHDISVRPKYRPMKHGIHYQNDDNTLYYNSIIEETDWEDEVVAAIRARDLAAAQHHTAEQCQQAYEAELVKQQRINAAAYATPPNWILIKRKTLNDTRMEDSLLQYADKEHTQVDWYSTLNTLRETGEKIGYTRDHYKRVLHRFISWFKPEMNQIGQLMNIDQLARLLMTSTMPANKTEMIMEEIKKLTRKPGESLRIPMANLLSLLNTYYETKLGAEHPQVSRLLFHGLLKLTSGETKEQLKKLIKYSQLHKIKLDYHDTLETCILSEKTNGEPAEDLKFDQSKETVMVFQSTISPVDTLTDTDRLRSPTPQPDEPFSSRRSRSKQRSGNQTRPPSPSDSSKSPDKRNKENAELTTAPNREQSQKKYQQEEHPSRKSERLQSRLYQLKTLLHEITADETAANSPRSSRDNSYSRDRSNQRDRSRSRDRSLSSYRSRDSSPYSNKSENRSSYSRTRSQSKDRYTRERTPNYGSSIEGSRYSNRSYSSERSSRESQSYRPESRTESDYSLNSRSSSYSRDHYSDHRSPSRDRDHDRRQRSRTPDLQSSKRSNSPYQNKTAIPGLNCSPSYKPGTNFCKKSIDDGHKEPDCRQYYHWAPLKCTVCNSGYHFRDQCNQNNHTRSDSPGKPKNF